MSRSTLATDHLASAPKNHERRRKSPVESPCKYKMGSSSVTLGDLGMEDAKIAELKCYFPAFVDPRRAHFDHPLPRHHLPVRADPLPTTRRFPAGAEL